MYRNRPNQKTRARCPCYLKSFRPAIADQLAHCQTDVNVNSLRAIACVVDGTPVARGRRKFFFAHVNRHVRRMLPAR